MASAPEREVAGGTRRRFLEMLMGSGAGPDPDSFMFFPVLVGLMGPPRGGDGSDSAAVGDRIVLVNPLTQGMVVLSTGGVPDLAAAMQEMVAAEGGAHGPPPASKASIEAMPAVERPTGEEDDEECAVCLDGLWAAAGEEVEAEKKVGVVKEMPCRHRFHGGCIEKWLGVNGSCPVCRYRMPEEKQPERKKEEGEEEGRRRGLEREIWVTLGFSRRAAEQPQQQAHHHGLEESGREQEQ